MYTNPRPKSRSKEPLLGHFGGALLAADQSDVDGNRTRKSLAAHQVESLAALAIVASHAESVLARNRTWSSTFAGSDASGTPQGRKRVARGERRAKNQTSCFFLTLDSLLLSLRSLLNKKTRRRKRRRAWRERDGWEPIRARDARRATRGVLHVPKQKQTWRASLT